MTGICGSINTSTLLSFMGASTVCHYHYSLHAAVDTGMAIYTTHTKLVAVVKPVKLDVIGDKTSKVWVIVLTISPDPDPIHVDHRHVYIDIIGNVQYFTRRGV